MSALHSVAEAQLSPASRPRARTTSLHANDQFHLPSVCVWFFFSTLLFLSSEMALALQMYCDIWFSEVRSKSLRRSSTVVTVGKNENSIVLDGSKATALAEVPW